MDDIWPRISHSASGFLPDVCTLSPVVCTVTYLPFGAGKAVLTQSRDEHESRMPSSPPELTEVGNLHVLRPVDGDAGGTWMALASSGRAVSLMNGAFESHKRVPPYRRSRGLVLMDSFEYGTPKEFEQHYDFDSIEPFTMVLAEPGSAGAVTELRWDGQQVHLAELDPKRPHIWSSAPLYAPPIQQQRVAWFGEWLMSNEQSAASLLRFHHEAGAGNPETDVRMKRSNGMQTMSITQITWAAQNACMAYSDLRSGAQEEMCLFVDDHSH